MKLYMAPLQGLTTAHYRNFHAEIFGGFNAYYAPFIGTADIRKASAKLFKDLDPECNAKNLSVIPQLLGNKGSDFNAFAKRIVAMGYSEINWNIGCPYPTVTKKKKGSGILEYPEMIRTFLEDVCESLDYDLSVKMRLGYSHLDEGLEVMKVLNDYPVSKVILHGRTGIQKYEGVVDLESFDTLARTCKHPLMYNGDIYTLEDYQRISEQLPYIKEFMIGRGALMDPFLAAAIKGQVVPDDEKLGRIRTYHDSVFQYYVENLSGDQHVCDKMKEFWDYLGVKMDPDQKHMKKIKKARSISAYLDAVHMIFKQCSTFK